MSHFLRSHQRALQRAAIASKLCPELLLGFRNSHPDTEPKPRTERTRVSAEFACEISTAIRPVSAIGKLDAGTGARFFESVSHLTSN